MFLLFNDAQFGNVRLKFAFSDCQHRATEPSAHKLTRSAKTHYSRAQECEADLTSQPAHDCRVRHGPGSCQAQRDTVEGDHDQRHKREKRRRYEQQVRDVEGTIICSAGFQHCGRNKPLFNCCNLQAHCSTIGEENRTNLRRCDKSCGLPAVSCTTEVRHYTVAWFKTPCSIDQFSASAGLGWGKSATLSMNIFCLFSFSEAISANTLVLQVTWIVMWSQSILFEALMCLLELCSIAVHLLLHLVRHIILSFLSSWSFFSHMFEKVKEVEVISPLRVLNSKARLELVTLEKKTCRFCCSQLWVSCISNHQMNKYFICLSLSLLHLVYGETPV